MLYCVFFLCFNLTACTNVNTTQLWGSHLEPCNPEPLNVSHTPSQYICLFAFFPTYVLIFLVYMSPERRGDNTGA